MSAPQNIERAADQRADRLAILVIAAFTALSWVLLSTSELIEADQNGLSLPTIRPWLIQFASHVATLIVLPVVPLTLSRARFRRKDALRTGLVLACGFAIFALGHILIMVFLRKLLWPMVLPGEYVFGFSNPLIWIYELRKDAYTFLLQIVVFGLFRQVEQLRLELATRRDDAQAHKRLTLKSGGRTLILRIDEVEWAQAAANYVELHTREESHLVRISLTELARLIDAAQPSHIRTHRSFLVKKDLIQQVVPDGEGGGAVTLRSGAAIPLGRTYRDALRHYLSQQNQHAS